MLRFLIPTTGVSKDMICIAGYTRNVDGFTLPMFSSGVFTWAPLPAIADVALEELHKARIKRQYSTMHIFVCPQTFTPQWLRQLHKAADLVFSVRRGTSMWPLSMFEPCLIGILFPFLRCKPWQLHGTPKMYSVGRSLSQMWENCGMDTSAFCANFAYNGGQWNQCQICVVQSVIH